MSLTPAQVLQSLLLNVTDYYTAYYSSDTDLYKILQMYSSVLSSGSVAADTVRNNTFVVTCEVDNLYNNFGVFFDTPKYKDQSNIEDRYISTSGSITNTSPAIYEDVDVLPNTWRYVYQGATAVTSYVQPTVIPGYRKQLSFLMEAAVKGSTVEGVKRAVQAFTLVTPDIREIPRLPGWKLRSFSGSVVQLSENVWQFGSYLREGIWNGAHMTFTNNSSTVTNKIAAGYIINTSSNNNTVTVMPIYNANLLWDLRRMSM